MGRKRKHPRRMPRQATGNVPDGKLVLAATDVPDPHVKGTTTRVYRNISPPAEYLHSRGILDQAEKAACDYFAALYGTAQIGGARAIDYSRTKVDGGQVGQPLSDAVMSANRRLAEIARVVGKEGYRLLDQIVGQEVWPGAIARDRARDAAGNPRKPTRTEEGYIVLRFKEALRTLIDELGLVAKGKPRGRLQASDEGHTGPVAEWAVGKWGDLVPTREAS